MKGPKARMPVRYESALVALITEKPGFDVELKSSWWG
jgi:hypothetical protein